MNQIERLIQAYAEFVSLPWDASLAGPQRVWFAVYDKSDERRLRARLGEFALATGNAKHGWAHHDLTHGFSRWMGGHKYRDSYFTAPQKLEMAFKDFKLAAAAPILKLLRESDGQTVVALSGIGSLFGLIRASDLIAQIQDAIAGRLLVFFPGQYDQNVYRLFDGHEGWNYLAVPITAYKGAVD